jgi:hypothetical protein
VKTTRVRRQGPGPRTRRSRVRYFVPIFPSELVPDGADTCRELPFCPLAEIRDSLRIPDAAGVYRGIRANMEQTSAGIGLDHHSRGHLGDRSAGSPAITSKGIRRSLASEQGTLVCSYGCSTLEVPQLNSAIDVFLALCDSGPKTEWPVRGRSPQEILSCSRGAEISNGPVFLRSNAIIEPLVDRFHVWAHV